MFDYGFAENGLIAYKDGKELARKVRICNTKCRYILALISFIFLQSIGDEIPNEKLKEFINYVLIYLATKVDCPVKR